MEPQCIYGLHITSYIKEHILNYVESYYTILSPITAYNGRIYTPRDKAALRIDIEFWKTIVSCLLAKRFQCQRFDHSADRQLLHLTTIMNIEAEETDREDDNDEAANDINRGHGPSSSSHEMAPGGCRVLPLGDLDDNALGRNVRQRRVHTRRNVPPIANGQLAIRDVEPLQAPPVVQSPSEAARDDFEFFFEEGC